MGTDVDIPATVDSIDDLRSTLAEHFKPTECNIRTHDGTVSVDMDYRGFTDFDAAIDHVTTHAGRLHGLPGCDDVHIRVATDGSNQYDDPDDDRPSGHLSATFTPSPDDATTD